MRKPRTFGDMLATCLLKNTLYVLPIALWIVGTELGALLGAPLGR